MLRSPLLAPAWLRRLPPLLRRGASGSAAAPAPPPASSASSAAAAAPRPPFAAVLLGGLGFTPFLFYSLQVGEGAALDGDALLRRWRRHLPEAAAPLLAAFETGGEPGARLRLVGYSAAILSFLGGVQWGGALSAPSGPRAAGAAARGLAMAASVAPSLVAWPAAVLAAEGRAGDALAILPLGFLGVFAADAAAVRAGLLPKSYMALRAPLTLAVVAAHLFAAVKARGSGGGGGGGGSGPAPAASAARKGA